LKRKIFKGIGATDAFIETLFITYKVIRSVWKLMLILDMTKSFKQILWTFMMV